MDPWLKFSRVTVLAFIFLCLLANPVIATSTGLQITPDTLSVYAESGLSKETYITVENPDSVTQEISINYIRVSDTKDYVGLQPNHLTFSRNLTTISPHGSIDAPVFLDTNNLPSGEYRGSFRVLSNATEFSLPLVVKVKTSLLLPLLTLLITVTLSVLLFNWGFSWQKNVVLRRNIAKLRSDVEKDTGLSENEFGRIFKQKIIATLDKASGKILELDYTEADEARKLAEKLWNRWNNDRVTWLEKFKEFDEIKNEIRQLEQKFLPYKGSFTFLPGLYDEIRKFWTDIADLKDNETISFASLLALKETISRIKNVLTSIQDVEQICNKIVNPQNKRDCCDKLSKFLRILRDTNLKDLNFDKIREDLAEIQTAQPDAAKMERTQMVFSVGLKSPLIPERDELFKLTPYTESVLLTRAILAMEFIKNTIVPIGILTIIGLYLLYFKNSIFGSPSDYLALILLGIMSCASKEGIWEKVTSLNPVKIDK